MKFQMKINFPWSKPLLACCFVMFALTAMADSFISFRQQGEHFLFPPPLRCLVSAWMLTKNKV